MAAKATHIHALLFCLRFMPEGSVSYCAINAAVYAAFGVLKAA
jgi:hypothetical protein